MDEREESPVIGLKQAPRDTSLADLTLSSSYSAVLSEFSHAMTRSGENNMRLSGAKVNCVLHR